MKVTLHLNGSAAAICAFLATVPAALIGGEGVGGMNDAPAPAFPMPDLTVQQDDDDTGPVNAAAPATDSNGMPWDARIHASTKGTNEDGTWRKKRKIDAAFVAAVEAELRGAPSGAAPVPAPVPMPAAIPMPMGAPMQMPSGLPPVVAAPAPVPMPAAIPMPAPVPVAAPTPVAAPAAEGIDFTGFMGHLTSKMQTGAVTSDDLISLVQQINAAFQPHGHAALGAITDLQTDPQKLTYAVQLLQHNGKW